MRNNQIKDKRSNTINRYDLICAFIAIFAIILAVSGMFVQADERSTIIYESILIDNDDTLWNIAVEYCDTDKENINEYISNVKELNNLSSDKITYGNYLLIYKYE